MTFPPSGGGGGGDPIPAKKTIFFRQNVENTQPAQKTF